MRIGVFGGTFNPPHIGHRRLAELVKQAVNLDRVLVIPTFIPPHKREQSLAAGEDRLEMCRRNFTEDYFTVSDTEIRREGKSYTFDTLCALKKDYPGDEIYLIIGSDMLLSFHRWYEYRKILSMATLCVISRESTVPCSQLADYARDTLGLSAERGEIILLDTEPLECSSTDIRFDLLCGGSGSPYLYQEVAEYIKEKSLYIDAYTPYRQLLRGRLKKKRFLHSLNVADSARELARLYGGDEEKAYFAGLLHDVMKNAEAADQLQIMEKGGIILSQTEKNNPKLWHAMAGAAYLRLEMGVEDEDIINAVRYHTTGRKGMSLLEKIIYIADFISAERDYPDVEVMRRLALNESLEAASLYSLQYTIGSLAPKAQLIHTDSVEYYNELIIERMKGDQTDDRA